MMPFGGGWFGILGLVMMAALLVGVALVVIWAAQGVGARGGNDAPAVLRSRFAPGEMDADQFEAMRRALAADDARRAGPNLGLVGLILLVVSVVLGLFACTIEVGG